MRLQPNFLNFVSVFSCPFASKYTFNAACYPCIIYSIIHAMFVLIYLAYVPFLNLKTNTACARACKNHDLKHSSSSRVKEVIYH